MINYTYSENQKKRYDFLVDFAQKELNTNVLERDKNQIFGKEEWLKCGSEKLHGMSIPEIYGGLGFNAVDTSIALEALGYGCEDGGLAFSLAAQLLSCTGPIILHGTNKQKEKYLPLLASGKIIVANAMTEKDTGSDVFNMHTTAQKSDTGFIVNGEKTYISNAPNCDSVLLYAATNIEKGFHGGISAFIIDSKKNGLTLSLPIDKMGLRSCMMGTIQFTNLELDTSDLLGKEGAGAMMFSESMNWERTLLGALHVGTMKRILEKSIAYVNSRKIKNESIGKYQANSHRIAEMYVLTETSGLLVHKAASEIDNKYSAIALSASATKLHVSESLNKVCDLALLIFGGNGYTTQTSIERYKRDAIAAYIYSGTNDIQKNIISKWLGI